MKSKSISSASMRSTKGRASIPLRPGWIPQSSIILRSVLRILIYVKANGNFNFLFTFELEHDAATTDFLAGTKRSNEQQVAFLARHIIGFSFTCHDFNQKLFLVRNLFSSCVHLGSFEKLLTELPGISRTLVAQLNFYCETTKSLLINLKETK
jgi:hypothetical protein